MYVRSNVIDVGFENKTKHFQWKININDKIRQLYTPLTVNTMY